MSVIEKIQLATERIAKQYIQLPIAYGQPKKRERVYCYELYHQIRLALGERRFSISAEPDKRGHPNFGGNRAPNPDLIIHLPGTHRRNIAVIEVECRPDLAHIRKDLKNLKLMKTKGYHTLIFLLFAVNSVPWRRIEKAAQEIDLSLSEFVVLLHPAAGRAASVERPSV